MKLVGFNSIEKIQGESKSINISFSENFIELVENKRTI